MSTDYSLQDLTEAELDAAWRINQQGNEDVAKEEPLLPAPMVAGALQQFCDEARAELDDDDHRHLVAIRGGACIGWAHGYVVVEPDGMRVGYVSAVYVDRASRGRGIGSAMLGELVKWLDETSVDRIQLMTPSRSHARALWLKRGFRPLMETMVLERPRGL